MYSLENAKKVKIKIPKKVIYFLLVKREKYIINIINIKKHNKREKIKKIKETEVEDLFKLFINKERVNNILIKKRSKKII